MQLIDRLREKIKRDRLSVLKVSTEVGIPAYRIYKWLDGKASPKHDDVVKIEKWLRNAKEIREIVDESQKENLVNEPEPSYQAKYIALLEKQAINYPDLLNRLKELGDILKQNHALLVSIHGQAAMGAEFDKLKHPDKSGGRKRIKDRNGT